MAGNLGAVGEAVGRARALDGEVFGMDMVTLRAERNRLFTRIGALDVEIRAAARERGVLWRRLYTQRMALWRRLNTVERRMVALYSESASSLG